jgi:hypothetical protein
LKTIYDALSAQNLSTPSRRSDHGMGATFMNWIYVLITWFGLGLATMSQPLGAIYPYVAPLACCRRIFRKADAIASKASNGSPNGNSAAALDAYATNHQVLSSAQSSGGTTSGTGNSSSFLPAGAIPHHHSDRDRERHSVSARNKMNDRLAIPGGAANMLGGGGGAGAGSGSNSAQSRHRRMQTHSRHGSSMMNADDDEPTMAPPMRPSSAAPSFSDDDETQVDMLHPPSHLDDADAERELSSQAFALSDSDESSMQSDPIADAGDHSGFPAVSHHSRHSSSRSQGRSSGGSQQYSGSQKAAMSTMAQLRNVSKRLKESSRRN